MDDAQSNASSAESSSADGDDDASAESGSTGSDSGSDEDKVKSEKRKKKRMSQGMSGLDADAEKITSHAVQQLIISLISMLCMFFIITLFAILTYLCIRVVDLAEGSGSEINNSDRRSYLAERLAYLSYELVHNGPASQVRRAPGDRSPPFPISWAPSRDPCPFGTPSPISWALSPTPGSQVQAEDLVDSEITWLRSLSVIHCQLERTVVALLSVHYALLYGTAAGWLDMAQGFERGPVREWGKAGSVDFCSPFTWDKESFDKAKSVGGSFGRYTPQDNLLFKSNCLTELPEADVPKSSFTFTHERVAPFSKVFLDGKSKCRLYNQRCRLLSSEQFNLLDAAEKRVQFSYQTQLVNLPGRDTFYPQLRQCSGNGTTDRYRTSPRADPCFGKPYPAGCYYGTEENRANCQCAGGEVSEEGCIAQAGEARDFACPDSVTSGGLHNMLSQVVERARMLNDESDNALTEDNANYRFVMDYYTTEWRQGLLAATLLYQHEAVMGMRANTVITQGGFGFVLIIVVLQYVFLSYRFRYSDHGPLPRARCVTLHECCSSCVRCNVGETGGAMER